MHYWNEANFKGLKEIGEQYSEKIEFEDFSKYCLLKEKGIKKLANRAIEDFVLCAKRKSKDVQREIAIELISLSYNNNHIHQLIPQQLHEYIIIVLKDWAENDESNVSPHRWLGYITRNIEHYEKAIKICPNDDISIMELAKTKLGGIDHQTHHLSESRFIGEIGEARNSLEYAFKLIDMLSVETDKNRLLDECKYFKRLLDAWEYYKKEIRDLSFPEWSISNGENFNFWSIFYYNK